MKKLIVNDDVCIGCGACVACDPTHFDFNENGLSSVINNDNLDAKELQNAIASCPVNAIKIENCCCDENCNCKDDNCTCDDDCTCGCKDNK